MYYYVYDEFVQDRKYEKELFQIENRLTDLGISGKIGRLALFKDPCELIKDEIRRGINTVILVGNDSTVDKVARIMSDVKVTFGLLPLDEQNNIFGKILGMPCGLPACDVISARIIRELDVGRINDRNFLSRILIPETNVAIRCESDFSISPSNKGDIEIRNWGTIDNKEQLLGNPEDGLFDLVVHAQIDKKRKESTTLQIKNLDIRTKEQIPIFVDGERINGNSFKIKMAPRGSKWIVGKERLF
jgi:hypothetical protein